MKRGRKPKQVIKQTYEVFLYRPHSSGIGATYIKTVYVTEKPSFDNGYYQDLTNQVWAIDIDNYNRKPQEIKTV